MPLLVRIFWHIVIGTILLTTLVGNAHAEETSCSTEWMTRNITAGKGIWYMSPNGRGASFQVPDFITPVQVKAPMVGTTSYKNTVGVYEVLPKGSTPVWSTNAYYFCPGFEPVPGSASLDHDPEFGPDVREYGYYVDDVYFLIPRNMVAIIYKDGTPAWFMRNPESACPDPNDSRALSDIITGAPIVASYDELLNGWRVSLANTAGHPGMVHVKWGTFLDPQAPIGTRVRRGAHTLPRDAEFVWICLSPDFQPQR